MSKGLEALKSIREKFFIQKGNTTIGDLGLFNRLNTIEKELKEYEQYKIIEEELGIDLITFLKGINPNTCFMEITKNKEFYLCGDAYYGNYKKEELLKLIQELLFMYWVLTKEELL